MVTDEEVEAIEVIEPQRAVVVAQPGQSIVAADTLTGPQDMLERAARLATTLAGMVEAQKLYTVISGKKYPQVEAWMTIGRMDNVVAREAHPPIRSEDESWEAEVELVRLSDGMVIGRASAMCGAKGDRPWDSRPTHQRRSMAVTRATSRAFRQQYSWIMALAGYEPTPADEMPVPDVSPRREDAPRRDEPDREDIVQHGDQGLIGSVEKGKPPVDMETRQTPNGPAWGFKLAQGRKGFQAIAVGSLAEVLAVSGLEEGTRVTVWGRVEEVPWFKGDKAMPPYLRVHMERVQTPDWTLPAEVHEHQWVNPDSGDGTPVYNDPICCICGIHPVAEGQELLPLDPPLDDDEKAAITAGLPGA